jgi:lipoprotein-anchoring transpeptidase ErfK/SrfK
MRVVPIAAAGLTLAVVATAATFTAVGASRQSSFSGRVAAIEHRWDAMVTDGVPPTSITPLRQTLRQSQFQASWWAPVWWTNTGNSVIDDLQKRTDAAMAAAVATARVNAQAVIDGWEQMATTEAQYLPPDAVTAQREWTTELALATTPTSIAALAGVWNGNIEVARRAADFKHLNAEVASYGGVSGLLANADKAVTTARRDNLDPGKVPDFENALRRALDTSGDATQALQDLVASVKALHSLIDLNNNVGSGVRPLMLLVDQAGAEGTPNAQSFLLQYHTLQQAFRDASTSTQLNAVNDELSTLQNTVNTELTANQCGHNVGSGKVITLNLTLQEMVFYQDGCVVNAAPSTTGRRSLRTPTGTFHIFFKTSPFTMVSPWPPGSPFWYPTGTVTWVMEFAGGGYFIHDAYWEPESAYGPGSEDTYSASHGCVHIPTSVMRWAYQWTPIGTPVYITY